MINPVRAAATFIFFACMAGTLYCALGMEKPNVLLVIVLCICQTCALRKQPSLRPCLLVAAINQADRVRPLPLFYIDY